MMTILVILVCLITINDAVKESENHGSANNNVNLIMDIIKRLGDSGFNYVSDELENSRADSPIKQSANNDLHNFRTSCKPVIQEGSIIKTTESINAGADYIDSFKNVKSNAACLEYCCQNLTCDVAVYQDKGDRYCYLFKCGNRCIFKPHSNYFVSTIKSRKFSEHPEEDLENLNREGTVSDSSNEKKVNLAAQKLPEKQENFPTAPELTTQRAVITSSQTEAPELVIAPHSVGLNGFCTEDKQCEDPNADCSHRNCVCKTNFYNKDGLCRKSCLASEFECYELGTLSRGPECVPRSQVCDSYLQCADGSDEFNCENSEFPSGMRSSNPSPLRKDQGEASHSLATGHKNDIIANNRKNQDLKMTPLPPTKAPTATTSEKVKASSTSQSIPVTPKPIPMSHGEKKHIFLASEKVIIASTRSDAEGPIIALSLGLAFTLILLVLVGCRLRNVRHRLRKGRPLHQNEADYLINGMYL